MTHAQSTTTLSTRAGDHNLSFFGVLHSEWIKFWSLRSTQILLIITFVAMVGVGAFAVWVRGIVASETQKAGLASDGSLTDPSGTSGPSTLQPGAELYSLPTSGLQLGVLVIGTLAVLFIASEYGTGMIRSSFAAVPRRWPVFVAKATVIIAVSYVVAVAASFATYFVAQPILVGTPIEGKLTFDLEGLLPGIFLGGLYVAGVAFLGFSLATLLRNSAGAITILLGVFFIVGLMGDLLKMIPGDFWKEVPQYLPSQAAGRMLETVNSIPGYLDAGPGALVFLGWIALVTIPAVILFKRKDA